MQRVARAVHRVLLIIFLAGAALAVFLAGLGLFETTRTSKLADAKTTKLVESTHLDPHRAVGTLLILVTLLVALTALAAGVSRRQRVMAAMFFVLGVVQMFLAGAGASSGAFWGALHVVNAFLLVGLAIDLLMMDLRASRSIQDGSQRPPAPA